MKIKTDDNGVTTCELSTQDRKTLAAAKTIVEKVAFHQRDSGGPGCMALATDIGAFLKRTVGTDEAAPESKDED
jgi:hypothetical protein